MDIKQIMPWLKNKYIITSIVFVLWMLFFDQNNLFNQLDNRKELNKLKTKEKYLEEETQKAKQEYKDLTYNNNALEKVAREKHLMKKEDEDLFIIQTDTIVKDR